MKTLLLGSDNSYNLTSYMWVSNAWFYLQSVSVGWFYIYHDKLPEIVSRFYNWSNETECEIHSWYLSQEWV